MISLLEPGILAFLTVGLKFWMTLPALAVVLEMLTGLAGFVYHIIDLHMIDFNVIGEACGIETSRHKSLLNGSQRERLRGRDEKVSIPGEFGGELHQKKERVEFRKADLVFISERG